MRAINYMCFDVIKIIIESLHGKIRVESKITEGACFIISLPKFG